MPETDPSFQVEQTPMTFHSNNLSHRVVFQLEMNLEDPEDQEHPVLFPLFNEYNAYGTLSSSLVLTNE
jgi:hypothetical protein